jgi:tRNA-dihydrouridine synthase A
MRCQRLCVFWWRKLQRTCSLQSTITFMNSRHSKEISIAPMMDRTDRHCRYFHRLLAPDIRLYTEMVVAQAIVRGDRGKLLAFDPAEQPLALQLGGSDPELLAQATRIAADYGYDEINLNIGCPSDRVQSGRFGACLMAESGRVADCVSAMSEAVDLPVTVKTRIGIDDHDSYEFLADFVGVVARGGCSKFVVHARKALLSGLSPRENRTIPPLRYDTVYRLKKDFPDLWIVINGGVRTTADVASHLQHVDGVMIGRQAYSDPYWLSDLQGLIGDGGEGWNPLSREQIVSQMADYAERQLAAGTRIHHISRHMLGLFAGRPGARGWRRFISEGAAKKSAGPEVLLESIAR